MKKSLTLSILALAVILALTATAPTAEAHSRLLSPRPRYGAYCSYHSFATDEVCPAAGYAPKELANPDALVYKRGTAVPIVWPRNNHPGGFISLSIIPFDMEETFENFEANVVQWSCHEATCKSGYSNDLLGEDAPGTPEDGNRCSTTLTIPTYLKDGKYTARWAWSNGGGFRVMERGHVDYYSAFDFTVSGGSYDASSRPACPTFIPGDAHNPASKGVCKFFSTDGSNFGYPRVCNPDGCSGELRDGQPGPLRDCLAKTGTSLNAPAAPAPAAPVPSVTAAPVRGAPAVREPDCSPTATVTVTNTVTVTVTVTPAVDDEE
ncbi:hypothetical protein H9P43_000776 [Blastocladiella emersonii ATCC 22665]|nr:hypothetical protein H9P43_000776 [Blastocladiella emersonii ATCC 22665]